MKARFRESADSEVRGGSAAVPRGLVGEALVVWLALLVFAVLNGSFRQQLLEPELGEEIAHFLSTTTLCGAVLVAALLFVGNRRRAPSPRELFGIGLLWSTSTVLFETAFGLSAGRRSASELFADYDVFRGRLFAFVIVVEIAAPSLAGWLRRWAERRSSGRLLPRGAGFRSVRANGFERTRQLPGDDLLGKTIASATHAVTIDRPRREIWPWLAQMGAGRAGWYSYDFIDNGGQRSAEELLPGLQSVQVGDLMPGLPGATEGFIVAACDPGRSLVLAWPSDDGTYMTTWAFVLQELGRDRTRLIVRSRAAPGYRFLGLPPSIAGPIARLGHFVMQRKQLIGIGRRAEAGERLAA